MKVITYNNNVKITKIIIDAQNKQLTYKITITIVSKLKIMIFSNTKKIAIVSIVVQTDLCIICTIHNLQDNNVS